MPIPGFIFIVVGIFQDCPYPCTCPAVGQEVCKGCEECPRQLGEPCAQDRPCDMQRGLVCRYKHGDAEGVCRGKLDIEYYYF